jgi:hypothetical protein
MGSWNDLKLKITGPAAERRRLVAEHVKDSRLTCSGGSAPCRQREEGEATILELEAKGPLWKAVNLLTQRFPGLVIDAEYWSERCDGSTTRTYRARCNDGKVTWR